MAKKLFVNPGTILDVHVITDPDIPLNAKEWGFQVRPQHHVIVVNYGGICVPVGTEVEMSTGFNSVWQMNLSKEEKDLIDRHRKEKLTGVR